MKTPDKASSLTFPCEFTIKVMGLANDDFEAEVLGIARSHIPNLAADAISSKHSGGKKYLSLSITLQAESQEQLDNLYQDLSKSTKVLFTL